MEVLNEAGDSARAMLASLSQGRGSQSAAGGFRVRLRRNGTDIGKVARVGGGTEITSLHALARLAATLLLPPEEYEHADMARATFYSYLAGGDTLDDFGLLCPDDVLYVAFGAEEFGTLTPLSHATASEAAFELPKPYRIRLDRVDVNQLSEVNQVDQHFAARVYLEFALIDGARDADLMKPGVVPPGPGRKPNAAWYLERLQIMNAREIIILEQAVRKHANGTDALMILHLRGTFFEAFELQNFPFDGQGLTITAVVLNRADGPFAVQLEIDRQHLQHGVDFAGFYHHSSWLLRELLLVSAHVVGFTSVDGDGNEYAKRFPAISIEAFVRRRPSYFLFSMFMPLGIISFLAFVQFSIAIDDPEWFDRVSHSATLLLTSAAYTSSVAEKLPDIGYLTLLDKYLLSCLLLLALCVVESPCVRMLTSLGTRGSDFRDTEGHNLDATRASLIDNTFFAVLGALWLALHCVVAVQAWHAYSQTTHLMTSEGLEELAQTTRKKQARAERFSRSNSGITLSQAGTGSPNSSSRLSGGARTMMPKAVFDAEKGRQATRRAAEASKKGRGKQPKHATFQNP